MDGLNLNDLLSKAQEVQKTIQEKQEAAVQQQYTASVGGGMVEIIVNGKPEVLSVKIDEEVVDKNDIELLEDLVRSACNEALRQVKENSTGSLQDMVKNFDLSMLQPK